MAARRARRRSLPAEARSLQGLAAGRPDLLDAALDERGDDEEAVLRPDLREEPPVNPPVK